MRVKTEAQRMVIIAAAVAEFRQNGYAGTSVSAVADRFGGSKATVYNYFASKEALFTTALIAQLDPGARHCFAVLDAERPGRSALLAFGEAYLTFQLSPEIIEITRVVIAQGSISDFGTRLYDRSVAGGLRRLARYLVDRHGEDAFAPHGAARAALELKSLLEADLVSQQLRGTRSSPNRSRIRQAVTLAVDAFLRLYPDVEGAGQQ